MAQKSLANLSPVFIDPALSFKTFFEAKTYGAGLAHVEYNLRRFERFKRAKIRALSDEGQRAFLKNIHRTQPRLGNAKDKNHVHILFSDLTQSYKG